MKTKKRIEVTFKKVEFMPDFEMFEDNVVYISDKYKSASHKCICGCGTLVDTGLMKQGWKYQIDSKDRLSMQPSIGNNQIPCKSHYVFYKGGANFF